MVARRNQLFTQSGFPNGGNEANDQFGRILAAGDFNGNGRGDLAIGSPYEDVGNETNRGKVNILYGQLSGLSTNNSQLWNQDRLSGSTTEAYDYFGNSLTVGDFDGDGYDDLSIGVPREDLGSTKDSGAVNVAYGSSRGLTRTGSQFWTQKSFPNGGDEANDRFGSSLAAGDFDGDGYDDLVIGTPLEDVGAETNRGKINVLRGSVSGLTSKGSQLWNQDSLTGSTTESDDKFGASLTIGDFNGDGYDDLAIGAPEEDLGSTKDAGAVSVMNGSRSGLTSRGSQFWTQKSFPNGGDEANDRFGTSLASGDFDGDGYDDLAIGTPYEDVGSETNRGKANVLYGSSTGLTKIGSQLWNQDKLRGSSTEKDDLFGTSLAVGDFNRDGYDDLVVGTPGEDIGSIKDAGAVNVIYGSASGLIATNNQFWHQNSTGIEGVSEAYDRFGYSLGVQDFNGDGFDDLAIGVPGEDVGSISNSGAVNILYGSTNGLVA